MRRFFAFGITALILSLLTFGAAGDPPDPFAEGVKLFNQGSCSQAIAALSDAVKSRPNDAVRRLTYGVALANSRRYDEAIAQFREVTRLLPDDSVAYFLLEGAYLAKGAATEAREARRIADQKLARAMSEGKAFGGTAPRLEKSGPRKDTLRAGQLEQYLVEHPDNAIAQNLLGDIYQVRGRYPEAVAHYKRATELARGWIKPWFNLGMANLAINPAEAAENFKRVIELDPKNLQAQLWLGDAYAQQNQLPLALQAYNNAANDRNLAVAARSRMGNVYLKQNQPQKAEQEFREAARQAPRDPVAAAGLGDALQQQRRYDESMKEYQRASDLTQTSPSQNAVVAPNLASIYIEKGEYRKAIAELRRVVSLSPALPDVIPMLVDAYQRGGLLSEGIADYEAALKKNPHDTTAMRFLVCAYAVSGNAQGRAQMAKKLLKSVPDEAPAWNRELGAGLVSLGDRKGALEAWRRGLEADPLFDSAGILSTALAAGMITDLTSWYEKQSAASKTPAPSLILASIYEARGDFRRAAEVRKNLVDRYPEKQHYWILLGDDLVRAGDMTEAKAVYQRAASMDDPALRAVAQERLNSLK